MISAKDEFFLEREHIEELTSLIQKSDLTHQELDSINFESMTEQDFDMLKRSLIDRELNELEAARRGCTLSAKQINKAVNRATNNE